MQAQIQIKQQQQQKDSLKEFRKALVIKIDILLSGDQNDKIKITNPDVQNLNIHLPEHTDQG